MVRISNFISYGYCIYYKIGADTNMKLKQAAMAFVQWVFRQASDSHLQTMGPVILSGLVKLLENLSDEKSKCLFLCILLQCLYSYYHF